MTLPDSCLWIYLTSRRETQETKEQIGLIINQPDVVMCEIVLFETLHGASLPRRELYASLFEGIPVLPTPPDLWTAATRLGQELAATGQNVKPLDILIAQWCLHHDAAVVSYDQHFEDIARVVPALSVTRLTRAA